MHKCVAQKNTLLFLYYANHPERIAFKMRKQLVAQFYFVNSLISLQIVKYFLFKTHLNISFKKSIQPFMYKKGSIHPLDTPFT